MRRDQIEQISGEGIEHSSDVTMTTSLQDELRKYQLLIIHVNAFYRERKRQASKKHREKVKQRRLQDEQRHQMLRQQLQMSQDFLTAFMGWNSQMNIMQEAYQFIRTDIEAMSAMVLQNSFLDGSKYQATSVREMLAQIEVASLEQLCSIAEYLTQDTTITLKSVTDAEEGDSIAFTVVPPLSLAEPNTASATHMSNTAIEDSLLAFLENYCETPRLENECLVASPPDLQLRRLPALMSLPSMGQAPAECDATLPFTLEYLRMVHDKLKECLSKLQERNCVLERKLSTV